MAGVKLAEWARTNGVHPQTAYRWFRQGTMPVPARRLPSGTILVDTSASPPGGRVVLYARVSAHDQRTDLARQVTRLTAWTTSQGVSVLRWSLRSAPPGTAVGQGSSGCSPTRRCA